MTAAIAASVVSATVYFFVPVGLLIWSLSGVDTLALTWIWMMVGPALLLLLMFSCIGGWITGAITDRVPRILIDSLNATVIGSRVRARLYIVIRGDMRHSAAAWDSPDRRSASNNSASSAAACCELWMSCVSSS